MQIPLLLEYDNMMFVAERMEGSWRIRLQGVRAHGPEDEDTAILLEGHFSPDDTAS